MSRKFRSWQATSLERMILVDRLRSVFKAYFSQTANDINSMFLVGGSGLGKSTLARLIGEHFDWGEVRRLQLTDDKWFKGDKLDTQAVARELTNISSEGTGLSRFFDSGDGKRKLFIIDELQQLSQDQQRRLNSAIEEQQDKICIIATMNTEYHSTRSSNSTLSRMEVIDFDILKQKQHRSELIKDMVRVGKLCINDIGVDSTIFSDRDLEEIAERTTHDFRDFFITLGRDYSVKTHNT